MNKDDFTAVIVSELNAATENFACETHADLLKQMVTDYLNLDETVEQILTGALRLSGGLTNEDGELALTIYEKGVDPKFQKSTAIFGKKSMDNRYWRKPYWPGGQNGVPGIGITREVIEAAANENAAVLLWDAARMDNDDLDSDDARGTWEWSFHFTSDWGFFPMSIGQATGIRTVDTDGHSILKFIVSNHQNTIQYEGTYEQDGWSGWISIIQAHNFINTDYSLFGGEPVHNAEQAITVTLQVPAEVLPTAIRLDGASDVDGNFPAIEVTALSNITHIIVQVDDSDVYLAIAKGVIDPGIDIGTHEENDSLYVAVGSSRLTFDYSDGCKKVGFLLADGSCFIDVAVGNAEPSQTPASGETEVVMGWSITDETSNPSGQITAADIEYGLDNNGVDGNVTMAVLDKTDFYKQTIADTVFYPKRTDNEPTVYKWMYVAVVQGDIDPPPVYLVKEQGKVAGAIIQNVPNVSGKTYTVYRMPHANNSVGVPLILQSA